MIRQLLFCCCDISSLSYYIIVTDKFEVACSHLYSYVTYFKVYLIGYVSFKTYFSRKRTAIWRAINDIKKLFSSLLYANFSFSFKFDEICTVEEQACSLLPLLDYKIVSSRACEL